MLDAKHSPSKARPGAQLNPRLTQGSTTGAHAGLAQLTSTHLRFNSTTDALGTVSATGDSLLSWAELPQSSSLGVCLELFPSRSCARSLHIYLCETSSRTAQGVLLLPLHRLDAEALSHISLADLTGKMHSV